MSDTAGTSLANHANELLYVISIKNAIQNISKIPPLWSPVLAIGTPEWLGNNWLQDRPLLISQIHGSSSMNFNNI
jgi:hypothetical protein